MEPAPAIDAPLVEPTARDPAGETETAPLLGTPATTARSRWFAALHPLLFAAYPVLFVWSQNLSEVNARDVVFPLAVLVGAAAVGTVALGVAFRDVRRSAIAVTPALIGLLMYGHVATAVAKLHVRPVLQQAGWAAIVVVALVLAIRLSAARIQMLGTALTRIGGVLIAVALVVIVPFEAGGVGAAHAADAAPLATATSAPKRDVYWFIFDRYGSDRSEKLMYGFDNDLTPWLASRGFTVLADSHANYVRTALSLSTTMSMAHLQTMPGLPATTSNDLTFVNDRILHSLVARQFQALGYRYVQVGSWWGPMRYSPIADQNLTLPGPSEFETTLIDASALPALQSRLHLGSAIDESTLQYRTSSYALDAVAGLRDAPGPKFVFAHLLMPHPPVVFDIDGSFRPASKANGLTQTERIVREIEYTNSRIRQLVSGMLSLPADRRPIIILQADEGPWSNLYSATRSTTFDWAKASDDDIEAKYGILNAWYLPGGEQIGLYPSMTSVNTFRTLFRGYFGLDYPALPDTVYTSKRWNLPYALTDVTARLPSLR